MLRGKYIIKIMDNKHNGFIENLFNEIPERIINPEQDTTLFDDMNVLLPNIDYRKNAYLHWDFQGTSSQGNQLFVMARAYMESAYKLCLIVLYDNRSKMADRLASPILFLYFHSVELYLKSIQYNLNVIFKKSINTTKDGHLIEGILKDIIESLQQLDDKHVTEEIRADLEQLNALWTEFKERVESKTQKDQVSIILRYPFDKKDNLYKFTQQNHENNGVVIDMEKLKNLIEMTDNVLYNLSCQTEDWRNR